MIGSLSVIILALLPCALAASHTVSRSNPIHVPIVGHAKSSDYVANLPKAMDTFKRKYASTATNMKRSESTGSVSLTDNGDVLYSVIVGVGTPVQNFKVALDTGTSGLWLATTACGECPSNISLFDPSKSSTYQSNPNSPNDTITFGGFTLPNQRFLPVSGIMDDIPAVSGTMGLAFQSNIPFLPTPFWRALYDQDMLSQPVFGLYLERHINQSGTAPGGTLTLGGTNANLYTGNIEFVDMPDSNSSMYWSQQVQTVTVQGTTISVPSNSGIAAILSGSSIIAAPSSIFQEIWAKVPGSVPLAGQYQDMYAYPCTTNITVSISFGGTNWAIDPADMNAGTIDVNSTQMCVGNIMDISYFNATGPPNWVLGEPFLKNVYSVFQANPPAIGFAQLSSSAGASSTSGAIGGPFPSALLALVMVLLAWFSVTI